MDLGQIIFIAVTVISICFMSPVQGIYELFVAVHFIRQVIV